MLSNVPPPDNRVLYEIMQNSACTSHAGYLRPQAHTQNIKYLLLFNGNSRYANAPQSYTCTASIVNIRNICSMTID